MGHDRKRTIIETKRIIWTIFTCSEQDPCKELLHNNNRTVGKEKKQEKSVACSVRIRQTPNCQLPASWWFGHGSALPCQCESAGDLLPTVFLAGTFCSARKLIPVCYLLTIASNYYYIRRLLPI